MKNEIINTLLKLNKKAIKNNEVPISALIVKNNKIIAKYYNKKNIENNALLHAEILCLYKVSKKLKRWYLNDCDLYCSLEPCEMCKNIINEFRINNVYFIVKSNYKINNKTHYEQMFDCDELLFKEQLRNFFINKR